MEIIDANKNVLRAVCHLRLLMFMPVKSRYGWLSGLGTFWCQNKAPLLTNKLAFLSLFHFFPLQPHRFSLQHPSSTSFVITSCTVFTTVFKTRQGICLYNRLVNCSSTPWFTKLVHDLQRACGSSRALVPVTIPLHSHLESHLIVG
jgi:hypothetical protein